MHHLPDDSVSSGAILPHLTGGAGSDLDPEIQAKMESRLGYPLKGVQIHVGPWATTAAAAMGATAFTVGNHIVFGAGAQDFASPDGSLLLAHELVHAVQQRHVNLDAVGPLLSIGSPEAQQEHSAELIAAGIHQDAPGCFIAPDDRPTIRRALAIDLSSAQMSASKGSSAARVRAGSQLALLHCTTNVNLAVADGAAGRATSGPMITFSAEVAFNADAQSNADRTELLMDWEFLFLQTSETISNEYEYAGRLSSEGSIRIDLKPGFVPNPCLDADETLTSNFPFLQNTSQATTPPGGNAARYVVRIESGDNPFGLIVHQGQNLVAKATNFMFKALRDERFVTLFLARNRKKRQTHFLAHQKWRVTWDAEFRWGFSGSKRPFDGFSSIDVDPTSVAGAPTDARVLAIMRNPQKPTANELDGRATRAAFGSMLPPLFQAFPNRHIAVPSDFFEELIA